MLEDTLTISEPTCFVGEDLCLPSRQIDGSALKETVLELHAVGPDVLHGSGSYFARDVGEVLHPVPTLVHTESHEFGPILAGLGTYDDIVAVLVNDFNALVVHQDDHAVEGVMGKQNVVATAENQVLFCFELWRLGELPQFSDVVDFDEMFRRGAESEAVIWLKIDVCFHGTKVIIFCLLASDCCLLKNYYFCDMKRVIVSVINDLVTDQRVNKSCLTLQKMGYEVLLVGRRQRKSPPMDERPYGTHRMKLLFEKGPLFYAEYNTRLFLFLLFHKANLLLSNDLDTALPNYFISKMKGVRMIYDSHEYFTETPELVTRQKVQKVWKRIEGFVVPRLKEMITVCDSIAELFEQKYGVKCHVVRNIPPRAALPPKGDKKALNLPEDKHLLVLQGSGINIQRGAEELVEAMQYLDDCHLMIIGGGDVLPTLKQMSHDLHIEDRIRFFPRMPYQQMMAYTQLAELGFVLDKDTNLNYRFCLPNKLFDFIQAGVPIVASNLVEVGKIIKKYDIGLFIPDHDPKSIAATIRQGLDDQEARMRWQKGLLEAAQDLCWENEQQTLIEIYKHYE